MSKKAALVQACSKVIHHHCDITPTLSTSGGTSDGRFIFRLCPEIVELGPNNATIHQIDECIHIPELEKLTSIYHDILVELL